MELITPDIAMEETTEDINRKVSARIRDREKGKDYKDTDVVNYTRKYNAAYDIVTSQDLTKIETDNVTAYKLIEKSKIWPLYNTAELKEQGNSSGAAYLKVRLREALSARPLDSKDARETYVRSIEKLRTLLEQAKSVTAVTDTLKMFVNLDLFDFGVIPSTVRPSNYISTSYVGNLKNYRTHDVEKYFDDIFGRRFYAFCKFSTEATRKIAVEARLYEGFSEEMEAASIKQKQATAQNYIDKHQKVIEAVEKMPDDKAQIRLKVYELDQYPNVTSFAKADVLASYNKQIELWQKTKDSAKASLPKYFLAREDDWSWTGEKKKTEKVSIDELDKVAKSTQTIFQKYGIEDWKKSAARTPLEYIKRTGGLTVEDIEVIKVTEEFGYRNVVFGNYVNNQERKENLRHFLGAMLDLHEVINIDIKEINKLGGLDINFGSTGCGHFSRAMACYYPSLKAINLTKKKGDGSLAHEWSHYLDNLLGEGAERRATNSQMATEYKSFLNNSEKIKTLFLEYKNWLATGGEEREVLVKYAPQRKYKFRLQGSTIEEAIKHVQARYPNYSKYENSESQDLLKYYGYIAYLLNDKKPLEVPLKTKSSFYYYISSCWGFDYYAAYDELFARAFAWFIEDALEQKGRVSNYLVDNVAGMGVMAQMLPKDQWPFPYKEEEKSFLRDWFDRLFSAIRTEYNIQPFHWNTVERGDEYSAYATDKSAKIETGVIVENNGEVKSEGDIEEFAEGYEFKRTVQQEKTVYQLIFGKEPKNVLISKLTKKGWNVYSKADDGTAVKFTEEVFKTYKAAGDYVVEKEITEPITPTIAEPEPSVSEMFELPEPKNLTELEEGVDTILSQYAHRAMAATQVSKYIETYPDLGKEFAATHGLNSTEELKKYLLGRQSKARKEVIEEKKKDLQAANASITDTHVDNIINQALEQSAEMDEKIKSTEPIKSPWIPVKIEDVKEGDIVSLPNSIVGEGNMSETQIVDRIKNDGTYITLFGIGGEVVKRKIGLEMRKKLSPKETFGSETMLTEGINIGDEGMWHGGERRVKNFDELGNVILAELNEEGDEINETKVSLDAFKKEFAKFPIRVADELEKLEEKEIKVNPNYKYQNSANQFLAEASPRQLLVVKAMLNDIPYDKLTNDLGDIKEVRFYEGLSGKLGLFVGNNSFSSAYQNKPFGEFQQAIQSKVKEMFLPAGKSSYTNIKTCLLSDGDNENDYIVEGTKIHSLTGDKKVTYEVLEFEKDGIILKHIPDSVLDDPRTNKYVTYLELTEMFETGKISIDNIQSVQSVIHCVKAIKTCFEKLDLEGYKVEVQERLNEADKEIQALKAQTTDRANYIFDKSMDAYESATPERKAEMITHVKNELERNERGNKIGFPLDAHMVLAANKFLKAVQPAIEIVEPPADELSLQSYKDALEGAETALEFIEDEKEKQDLQDYIEGLKIAIETM